MISGPIAHAPRKAKATSALAEKRASLVPFQSPTLASQWKPCVTSRIAPVARPASALRTNATHGKFISFISLQMQLTLLDQVLFAMYHRCF